MSLAEDLKSNISSILSQKWDARDGNVVPETEDVQLAGGAVKLDATVLYADLSQSSELATDFYQGTAAKVIRAFLYCMSRLITEQDGKVTSFDGDRVMGVFLGNSKNTNASTCALKMNYAVTNFVEPMVRDYFKSLEDAGFGISHCVGVDTGPVLVARAGQRGANDLVWIGRAPNLAAKLSEIRKDGFHTYISNDVFTRMNESAKYGGQPRQLMWEERSYQFVERQITVWRSSWTWKP